MVSNIERQLITVVYIYASKSPIEKFVQEHPELVAPIADIQLLSGEQLSSGHKKFDLTRI